VSNIVGKYNSLHLERQSACKKAYGHARWHTARLIGEPQNFENPHTLFSAVEWQDTGYRLSKYEREKRGIKETDYDV
jgi:hypothetical protein